MSKISLIQVTNKLHIFKAFFQKTKSIVNQLIKVSATMMNSRNQRLMKKRD